MIKIKGLQNITKILEDAARAAEEIHGEIGHITLNPFDPASIEAAIQTMETLVDDRLGPYGSNPIVSNMAEQIKESCRQRIIDMAAEARLSKEGSPE